MQEEPRHRRWGSSLLIWRVKSRVDLFETPALEVECFGAEELQSLCARNLLKSY
jgi:hypothetical protein